MEILVNRILYIEKIIDIHGSTRLTSQTTYILKIKISGSDAVEIEYTDFGNNAEYESYLHYYYNGKIGNWSDKLSDEDEEMVKLALDDYSYKISERSMFMLDYENYKVTPITFIKNLFEEN